MLYLISLLPIACYLFLLRETDAFRMMQWRRVMYSIAYGMACAAILWAISFCWKALHDGQGWQTTWISPTLEEILKALILLFFISKQRMAFLCEAMIYGASVGGGFALLENILYLQFAPDMALGTAIIRGFGTALLHMGCTAFIASLALVISRWWRLFAFIPSILIHWLHNMQLFIPFVQLFVVVVVFLLLFMLIDIINNHRITRWLDSTLNDDVNMLLAFRRGELANTRAGQYLKEIGGHFEQEVFFDMIVYVRLYIELSLAAKSRLMLRESGLETPESEEQRELREANIEELRQLRLRIPRLGRRLLMPIVHENTANEWAINSEL